MLQEFCYSNDIKLTFALSNLCCISFRGSQDFKFYYFVSEDIEEDVLLVLELQHGYLGNQIIWFYGLLCMAAIYIVTTFRKCKISSQMITTKEWISRHRTMKFFNRVFSQTKQLLHVLYSLAHAICTVKKRQTLMKCAAFAIRIGFLWIYGAVLLVITS